MRQEMDSVDAAQRLMEDHIREAVQMDGMILDMEFSHSSGGGGGGFGGGGGGGGYGGVSSGAHDWVCPMCQGINFFRSVMYTVGVTLSFPV